MTAKSSVIYDPFMIWDPYTTSTSWGTIGNVTGITCGATTTTAPTITIGTSEYASTSTTWGNFGLDVAGDGAITGDLKIGGDLTIGGKKISEQLDKIEQLLGIIHQNGALEERWAKLKLLGDQYRAAEKDIIEKEKMWDIIKK